MRSSAQFFTKQIRCLIKDERGAVSVIMGVLMIPLVGALAVGFEVSNWYLTVRGMQNAADAAVMAAVTNAGPNYDIEAKAVAAQYGFIHGSNTITVAASNAAACPDGATNCYSVAISGFVPLLLSQVVGFRGDTTLNGTLEKKLSSVAVAKPGNQPQDICMLALAGSGAAQGIRTNGAPVANMNGCNVMSNTNAQCNGSNLGAGFGFAHGTSNGCGVKPV
ncbi:MAG TPA: pilus assembly protein TadG-related protein, partial [Bradyrhizobium sp.]|nr:pilus assembly protein TadG-related protein [Bradyrhizobium sp.]